MDKTTNSNSLHNPSPPNLYVCKRCRKAFQLYSLYACSHGLYMCRSCYHKTTMGSNYNLDKSSFEMDDGTSLMQPTSYLRRDQEARPVSKSPERKRQMFPNPSIFQQNTIDKHNSLISLATIYKPSLLQMTPSSKRPIICPQYDCRKTIAVSSLDAHFHREHHHVATIVTQLETRNCLEFNFKDLRGQTRNMCLVLIQLETNSETQSYAEDENAVIQKNNYSKASGGSRSCGEQQRPFFILIAAKMPIGNVEDKSDTYQSTYTTQERVFFYVSSNIVGSYSYTIAVSTPIQNIRIKYFGPVLSVNEDSRTLCEEGKGLVLNHYTINGMSNGCSIPVSLDLILHEREEQVISLSDFI